MKTHRLFTKEECNDIISTLLNEYELVHYDKPYGNSSTKYNKVTIDKSYWFYDRIKDWVNKELNIDTNSTLLFVKYNVGDRFLVHVDRVKESEYHCDFLWNVNIILNEGYEGGEFIINNTHYKEPAGTIYYYSSDMLHSVSEITKGERYVFLYHVRERDIKEYENI